MTLFAVLTGYSNLFHRYNLINLTNYSLHRVFAGETISSFQAILGDLAGNCGAAQ